jgi:hypothetical protein
VTIESKRIATQIKNEQESGASISFPEHSQIRAIKSPQAISDNNKGQGALLKKTYT